MSHAGMELNTKNTIIINIFRKQKVDMENKLYLD